MRSWSRRSSCDGSIPSSLGQHFPGTLVRIQRIRLAAVAVERQHQPSPQALPQRIVGQQRLDLPHRPPGHARGQHALDPILLRLEAKVVQASRLQPGTTVVRPDPPAPAPARVPRASSSVATATVGSIGSAFRASRTSASNSSSRARPAAPPAGSPAAALEPPLADRAPQVRDVGVKGVAGPSGGSSPQTSSIRVSAGTTWLARRSSDPSTARCFGPPNGSGPAPASTSSGPRTRNDRSASRGICRTAN